MIQTKLHSVLKSRILDLLIKGFFVRCSIANRRTLNGVKNPSSILIKYTDLGSKNTFFCGSNALEYISFEARKDCFLVTKFPSIPNAVYRLFLLFAMKNNVIG